MRQKIAIVHPGFDWGGSEAAALWLLETLKNNYDISLITSGNVNIPHLNKFYGVGLSQKDFSIILVHLPFWLKKSKKFAAVKGRLLQRYCQRLAPKFDLMISTYNPINFKKKSIQFIADFSFDERIRQNLGLIKGNWKKWYHASGFFRKTYLKICDLISPISPEYWKNDIIVANSEWTAKLIKQEYGVRTGVIYPPVIGNFPNIPWEKRENGFVYIGRIAPEKRIDVVINILEKVRDRGCDINLHIAGNFDNSEYSKNLKDLCLRHNDWIFLEGKVNQKEKKKLIAQNRYGINGCLRDSFGISVAEMVKAGCIVFVPDGGGQTEIVNNLNLIYNSIEDAVEKIEFIIKNERLQIDLRSYLLINASKFSTEIFKNEAKKLVNNFFV